MADVVAKMVKEKPVVFLSKSSCCVCHTIKTVLSDFRVNTAIYELGKIPEGKEVEQSLTRRGCSPGRFLGGGFVGGAKEVMSLHRNRSLVPMLERAGA